MQRILINFNFLFFRKKKLCEVEQIEENSSVDGNNKIKHHSYTTYTNELQLDSGERLQYRSVADPGCLSRIPGSYFYPSRIPDLESRIPYPTTTARKEEGKKLVLP